MSLADPQTVTIGGTTTPLPRVSVGDDMSEYQSGDGLIKLTASHNYGKRTRRMVRLDTSKMTADPFRPAENVKVSMSVYSVVDLPPAGWTAAEQLAAWIGFRTQLVASSDAIIVKLLGGES
jgi:hypothetical protein